MKYLGAPLAWIVAIVMAFLFLGQCRKGAPAIPPETQARADSLDATLAEAAELREANLRLADSVAELGAALRRRTVPARAAASASGVTADSAAILAERAETARDSAVAWQAAYIARTKEVQSLETVVATLDSAAVQDSIAIATLQRGWALDLDRLATETLTRHELQAAIARTNECRILWVVDCPTRTQAAIGGILLGVVAVKWGDDLVRAVRR